MDDNRQVIEAFDLGAVTVPSGVLVVGMASWIDYWPEIGEKLSQRIAAAATHEHGGSHLRDWLCEAVAVRAGPGPLPVRATASPSPFDGEPTIAILEVGLGVPWPSGAGRDPVLLGDLPVDRCGMVLGDSSALDAFVGLSKSGRADFAAIDGLADVAYWGLHKDAAHAVFGGEVLPSPGHPRGWLDLPTDQARALGASLRAWAQEHVGGRGLMVSVDKHSDYTRMERATWGQPLRAATIEIADCQVLGIFWDPGDYSMLHGGERQYGQVYPVFLEPDGDGTLMRWTILRATN